MCPIHIYIKGLVPSIFSSVGRHEEAEFERPQGTVHAKQGTTSY